MIRLLLILLISISFSLLCSIGNASDAATNPLSSKVGLGNATGIFILAGQSNASGRGLLDASTEAPHPRVTMYGNDYLWKEASEPVDSALNQLDTVSRDTTARHGFSLRAAKDLVLSGDRDIKIVPCPKGGTSLNQWRRPAKLMDRSTLFGSCNYRRFMAAPEGITAMWWYQGESDRIDSRRPFFIEKHTAVLNEFRQEIDANMIMIYVQLARYNIELSNQQQFIISEYQRQLESGSGYAVSLPLHYMVVTFDLGLIDNVHIDQAAQKELGRRVALATRQHVYGESVEGSGPRLLLNSPVSYMQGSKSVIQVRFNQPVNEAVSAYDNQFQVHEGPGELLISNVSRDNSDPATINIVMRDTPSATATVSYGAVFTGSKQALLNVIKGENQLPAPRFGPIEVHAPATPTSTPTNTPTFTSTFTPTNTATPTPRFPDFNDDGSVESIDLLMLLDGIVGNETAFDINGDNLADYLDILQFNYYWRQNR
jgi:Carbohydrate esterase, sialic acid-specific acetylesterase